MIAEATFKRKKTYAESNLTDYWRDFWNSETGNCFAFNDIPNMETIQSQIPGPNGGLSMELKVEEDAYISNIGRDIGARFVDLDSSGIFNKLFRLTLYFGRLLVGSPT